MTLTTRSMPTTWPPRPRDADKDFDDLSDDGITSLTGIWSDNTTMWMADSSDDKLYAYTLTTKARDAGKDFDTLDADNDAPYGMWSNGATMWVTDSSDDKLYAYDMNTKARDADKDFDTLSDAGLSIPIAIWSDGTTMWVSQWRNNKLFAFNLSTKARDDTKDFTNLNAAGNDYTAGIWSNGITMWVADGDDYKIYSYVHRVLGSDTTLSAISLDGTDLTPFDSDSASHRHFVESDVTEITVAATATDDAASVEITSPADADDTEDGHQVSIGEGTTTVTFTVTAEDGTSQEQTLSIIKPSNAYFDWKQTEDFDTLADAGNQLPVAIWSDGTTMWVADNQDAKIYAYDLTTKARDETKDFDTLAAADNTAPTGMWSDGTTMWVLDWGDDKIYAYDLATKARDPDKDFETLETGSLQSHTGIWSDGTTMWVVDRTGDKLSAYDMATKAHEPDKDFNNLYSSGASEPQGIWSGGRTMWTGDHSDKKLYAYNMETKAHDPDKDFNTLAATGNERPYGIWSDGITLWVADHDDDKLYSYNLSRDEALDLKFLNIDGEYPEYPEDFEDFNMAGFDPDITEYEHTEPLLHYAEIRALTKDPDAHLFYDRPSVLPSVLPTDPLHNVALNDGENVLNITVTADGNPTYKQYTLTLPTIDDVPNEYGTTAWVIPAPQGSPAPRTRGTISEAGDIDWINVLMEPDQLYEVVLKGKAFGNSDRTLTMPYLGGIVAGQRIQGGTDPDTGLTQPPIFTFVYFEGTDSIGAPQASGLSGWARTIFRHSESVSTAQLFQVVVAGTFAENVGTYDVQVREVEDEHYPNDHSGAVDITPGIPVRGKIDYRFDQDWFRTTDLLAGHKYVIEARNGDNCHVYDVYDPDGNFINLGSRGCRFAFEPEVPGRHYIKVYGLAPWARGAYKLYLHDLVPISGNIIVGETLSVDPTDIFDPDGLVRATNNDRWKFQWFNAGIDATGNDPIRGANGREYTVTAGDVGNFIKVRICYRDDNNPTSRRRECRYSAVVGPIKDVVTVPSTWPRIPSGLNAGDQFRSLVVSKDTRNATSSDVNVYRTWVHQQIRNGHADIQTYTKHFAVVGSTSAVSARVNTGTDFTDDNQGIPIYWLRGQKVADDYADFYDGSWDHRNPGTRSDGNSITFTAR